MRRREDLSDQDILARIELMDRRMKRFRAMDNQASRAYIDASSAVDGSDEDWNYTEWREPDGGYTWEFPRGPTGVVTYMVDMAPDHKLKAVRQVLTDDYFAKIERGMPREAVRRLVGRPGETMFFPNLQEDVWTWRYEIGSNDVWFFHVHFGVDGGVKRTSRNKFDQNP